MDKLIGDAASTAPALPGVPAAAPAADAGPAPEPEQDAGGSKSAVAALLQSDSGAAKNVMLDLGITGYTSEAPDARMEGKSASRMKLMKGVKKVAIMSKVVDDMGSSTIFEALDKQKKSKNPFVNMYRWIMNASFNPYSRAHIVWDLFILGLVFYSSIMEPYKAAFVQTFVVDGREMDEDLINLERLEPGFRQSASPGMSAGEIMVDLAFYLDIIFNFWTGFDRGYEIVYEKKVIAKNYLAMWFWIDMLATVEWDLIVGALFPEVDQGTVRLVRLIKVARLARASRLVHRLTSSWTMNTGFVEATKFIVYVLICAHILGCFFFMVPTLTTCTGIQTPFFQVDDDDVPMLNAENLIPSYFADDTQPVDYERGHPFEQMKSDCMLNSWRHGAFDDWDPDMPVFAENVDCLPSYTCRAKYAAICAAHDASTCNSEMSPSNSTLHVCYWMDTKDGAGTEGCLAVEPYHPSSPWGGVPKSLRCGALHGLEVTGEERDGGGLYQTQCEGDPFVGAGVCEVQQNELHVMEDGKCETIVGTGDWKPLMSRTYAYVMSFYWAVTTMTTIGYGDIGPSSPPEIVFVLFAEIIGLSFFAVLLDQINKLNDVLGKAEAEANGTKNTVIGFLKQNNAPMDLIHSTIAFLNFKASSNSGSTMEDGFDVLSEPLKRRIKIALFKPALINVKMLGWAKDSIAEAKRVEDLFNETDEDGGGTLDHGEIANLVKSLGMSMTPAQLQVAFDEMDPDHDGTIDMEEFEQWWFIKKFKVPKIVPPTVGFMEEMAYRMSERTKAVAPQDHIVEAGEYGDRLYILLTGKIIINGSGELPGDLSLPREVRHEAREPVFGLSAALRPQYQRAIDDVTRDWTVDAVTYCDLVYLEKETCPEVFATTWPSGPEELLRVAKCFYTFDESGILLTPEESAAMSKSPSLLPGEMAADGDAVAEASLKLNAKIATVSATLKTKLSDIDGKLNKLLAA